MQREILAILPPFDRWALQQAMTRVGMAGYPEITGDPYGQRASGDCVCECGLAYRVHPLDWRERGYDGQAYLHILCDGRRVKL